MSPDAGGLGLVPGAGTIDQGRYSTQLTSFLTFLSTQTRPIHVLGGLLLARTTGTAIADCLKNPHWIKSMSRLTKHSSRGKGESTDVILHSYNMVKLSINKLPPEKPKVSNLATLRFCFGFNRL